MGVDKHRRKAIFRDGATFTGSVGISNGLALSGVFTLTSSAAASPQSLTGAQNFNAPVTVGGKLTVNSVPAMKGNSWTSTSGTNVNAFCGITQVGCGVASAVVSCSVVKSNAIIQLTPIMRSALISTASNGPLCVSTIQEGGSFTIGYMNGVGLVNGCVDVAWQITLQA